MSTLRHPRQQASPGAHTPSLLTCHLSEDIDPAGGAGAADTGAAAPIGPGQAQDGGSAPTPGPMSNRSGPAAGRSRDQSGQGVCERPRTTRPRCPCHLHPIPSPGAGSWEGSGQPGPHWTRLARPAAAPQRHPDKFQPRGGAGPRVPGSLDPEQEAEPAAQPGESAWRSRRRGSAVPRRRRQRLRARGGCCAPAPRAGPGGAAPRFRRRRSPRCAQARRPRPQPHLARPPSATKAVPSSARRAPLPLTSPASRFLANLCLVTLLLSPPRPRHAFCPPARSARLSPGLRGCEAR